MSEEQKLMNNVKEAATLVGISTGIGATVEYGFRKKILGNPATSLTNFGQWSLVLVGAIYLRDYLLKNKYIPQ